MDAQVGKSLFEKLIGPNGFLAKTNSTRILVTHQVHLLQQADHKVIFDQGRIVQQGANIELDNQLTDSFSNPPEDETKDIDHESEKLHEQPRKSGLNLRRESILSANSEPTVS